jgi:hypothetical protein
MSSKSRELVRQSLPLEVDEDHDWEAAWIDLGGEG